MRLGSIQRSSLLSELIDHFTPEDFGVFLLIKLDRHLDKITSKNSFNAKALDVLNNAEQENWLLDLLKSMKIERAGTTLETVIDEILCRTNAKFSWYQCNDPVKAKFIGHIPFVDRHEIRNCIYELKRQSRQNVLVICGDTGAGKSYIWNYIYYCFGSIVEATCALIELEDYQEIHSVDDVRLMESILGKFKVSAPLVVDKNAQDFARATKLIDQLAKLTDDNKDRFIVIDSLDSNILSEKGFALLHQLMIEVSRGNLPGIRMILMGYKQDIPRTSTVHIMTEKLAALNQSDLQEFFKDLADEIDVELPNPTAIQAADRVIELTNEDKNNFLHEQISAVAEMLFAVGEV